MKRIIGVLLILAVSFGCFGCGEKTATEPEKKKEKELSFDSVMNVFSHKPDTLCPLLSDNETNVQMLQMVFDGLIVLTEDLSAEPALAESWTSSEDGKTWTLKLREGVKWHDDSTFEAKDVVYTVNQIKKNTSSVYYYNVSNISDVKANGQSEVQIVLNIPWVNFVNLLYFPIVKSGNGDINSDTFLPVGTGAYSFESKMDDGEYYLVRNDEWWGGRPVTECITVKILADAETALHAFSAGTIDLTPVSDENWGKYIDSETSTYTTMESSELSFIGINNGNGALKFPEVRRAISYAVNRDEIVNSIMMDYATATRVPAHPGWAVSRNSKFETAQDLEFAKIELEAYEWVKVGDNWGKTVDEEYYTTSFGLLYNEENSTRELIAKMIEENLESVGIAVTLEKLSYEEYRNRINSGEYDMFIGSTIVSPDVDFSFFVAPGNLFGFSSDELQNIRSSMKKTDESELAALYAPLLKKLNEENPVVSLFFEKKILLHSNRIEGQLKPTSFKVFRGIEGLQKKEAEE